MGPKKRDIPDLAAVPAAAAPAAGAADQDRADDHQHDGEQGDQGDQGMHGGPRWRGRATVAAGHLAQKARKVHVRGVVGAVGDGAHHRQRHTEVVADLGEGGAFHFHRQRIGQFALQGLAFGGGGDEAVATDQQALVQAG